MIKSQLISAIASKANHSTHKDIELIVNGILDRISDALSEGERIEIRGFGSFTPRIRQERMARNPKTGEPVLTPKKRVPHFTPGKELRERVNKNRPKYPIEEA